MTPHDLLIMLAVMTAYFVLVRWVLPRFGIRMG